MRWEEAQGRTTHIDSTGNLSGSGIQIERLMIYDASLTLVVEEPNSVRPSLQKIAEKYEGYAQKLGSYETILRVNAKSLEQALEEIGQLGKVKNKNVTGRDVTEEYQDIDIRLNNAKKYQERYLALLDKAETVEEILKIEKELKRINTEIDLLTGKLKFMDNQIAYATITIDIQRKIKPGPLGFIFVGLGKAVAWIFVRNVNYE